MQARVRGEGDDVLVAGVVSGLGSPGHLGHVDIAVYAADGEPILSASAPYVAADEGRASFTERLPELRGRQIRLRLAHHGVDLPAGVSACANNAAADDGPAATGDRAAGNVSGRRAVAERGGKSRRSSK